MIIVAVGAWAVAVIVVGWSVIKTLALRERIKPLEAEVKRRDTEIRHLKRNHEYRWLQCEISKGMFSDEVTVRIASTGGQTVAVFVPKSQTPVSVAATDIHGET